MLSQDLGDNCLNRVRAHYADLAAGAAETGRVKLILLGNGGVGKTQIARWLAEKPFDEAWDSTHGIAVGGVTLADDAATQMQIWDFGGQEIYHGAHALFLGGPAVIAIVWDPATEAEPMQTCNGLTFRNQPLAYWAAVARHLGHRDSPLLVIQSKCDRLEQEVRTPPLPAGLLDHRPYTKNLQVSAKAKRGRASLLETLADAATWLRAPERLGAVRVGAGRLRVQQRLEAMIAADQYRSPDERQHRLLTMDAFTDLCSEAGGVSSPAALLTYLDAEGTVLHRPGLFDDRIILDQNWALEAVYAVFERDRGAFTEIRRANGRFTRDLLARLVWQNHSAAEQDLFLDLMRSCGIAFEHRRFTIDDDGAETIEYIAPELLPATTDTGGLWTAGDPTETVTFDYPLLHGGLIRSVMAELGGRAGANARYWRDGLCGFEADSQSRLWIDQTTGTDPATPWQGHLRLRTQGGNARELMDQLVRVVERAQQRVGLTPSTVTRSSPPDPRTEPRALTLVQEKPNQPEWYVSYAWGDDSEDGKAREAIVDRLCDAAAERGRVIVRDKNELSLGDNLIRFMERIGQGDRVFVILSNKYLASPNCMFELTELWRTSKQDPALFRSRVRICALPKTEIWTDDHRNHWIDHWEEQENKLFERIQKSKIAAMADANHRNLKLFHRFSTQVADILSNLTDHIQPRTFEELEQYGLDDC
ncbi:COR domain-containing protein [Azospirillum griseum]|uniref:COR domain-containing protein n=1 Tax=Azospirillum griseum TaxID=2496639 RepID=UPI001FECCC69|nr:COR domain-containing protein [Azospirillum griseum]